MRNECVNNRVGPWTSSRLHKDDEVFGGAGERASVFLARVYTDFWPLGARGVRPIRSNESKKKKEEARHVFFGFVSLVCVFILLCVCVCTINPKCQKRSRVSLGVL